ncbi:S8 family serine peptidase [Sphaerisporangium melleum]|nr:S8 family serine peptidase [Sphaerisporangium melleum]
MFSRRPRTAIITAALALLAVTPPGHAAAAATVPAPQAPPTTLTLITGDVVTVASGRITVAGPDGEPIGARVITADGDTYVYPASAAQGVTSGLLDKQLFNVTRLVAEGYGDSLPLIVTYKDAPSARQARPFTGRELTSIDSVAVTREPGKATEFWATLTGSSPTARAAARNGIKKVWLDAKVHADLADTVAQIGAPEVWSGGDTGEGVDVAVLDTGIDAEHPDLVGQVESSASFVPGEEVTDRNGHGTHVASTIAGTGAASGGKEKGVAPGADLHIGKVLDNGGSGYTSWIIEGMEWATRDEKAKIVSMSLGSGPTDGTDPLSQAVNALSAETGALFTIAAGNAGPAAGTVGAPGAADAALTVGAVDGADAIADFSSRGPRLVDGALKPEITAPGVGVLAARSQYATQGEGDYLTLSGTSMATPHVAGAAALLAAAHPDWTGAQLKDALVSTAKATPDLGPYDGGSGRLDIAGTAKSTVFASGTAYLGIHPLGEDSGTPPRREVSYTNTSGSPVTLDLTLDAPEAPGGLFALSATTITVPAGGQATVTVSANLTGVAAKRTYTGVIEARGAGTPPVRTVIGVSTEDKLKHLRVTAKDRNGAPLWGDLTLMPKNDPSTPYYWWRVDGGSLDVLVPDGEYSLWMWGQVQGTHGADSIGVALMQVPVLTIDDDTDVTLDAATTREIKAVTPKDAVTGQVRMDYYRSNGQAAVIDSLTIAPEFDSLWAQPTPKVRAGEMALNVRWRKIEPLLSITSGKRSFDDLWVLPGATLLPAGTSDLQAVFAGEGRASDYAGLDAAGKVAVVRVGDDDEQVAAAAAAGVKLLLMVNDDLGRLRIPLRRTPLAVAGLSRTWGEELITRIQQGPVRLRVESNPDTGYLYDLVRYYDRSIPGDLTYRPSEHDLAKVQVDFRREAGDEVEEYRYDHSPHLDSAMGSTMPVRSKRFRTDWITADGALRWTTEVNQRGSDRMIRTQQLSASVDHRPGRTLTEQWFGPIQRPRLNASYDLPARTGDAIWAPLPGWGDSGADHVGLYGGSEATQSVSLYQGDKLLTREDGYIVAVEGLAAKRLPYRLVATTGRDAAAFPYSTRTETTWRFTSGTTARAEQLPLIQLDYQVETDGQGRASRRAPLTLLPSHLPGGPDSGTIKSLALQVSYDDGVTWRQERLTRHGDGWTAEPRPPSGARFMTLRATAQDKKDNALEQTIVRAYGLK